MIEDIRKYALSHYNEDAWDILVECWENEDIIEAMEGATTFEGAIKAILRTLRLMNERRLEVQSEIF